jgi:hypothetical protein
VNSYSHPEQQRDKKGKRTLLSIVKPMNNDVYIQQKKDISKGNQKDKSEFSKSSISGLSIIEGNLKSASNTEAIHSSKNKLSYLNTIRRSKNSQFPPELQAGYILQKSSCVINFIKEHQELISLLNEAYKELRKYFLSEDLRLKLVSDPEIAGDQQLFVYIFTALPVTDALKNIDEFDEQWWLDRVDRANGLLNFNLRFV